jgi:hypothetical protein
MVWHNNGRSRILLRHGLGRKEKQRSQNPGIPPISFSLSLSLSLPLSSPLSFSDEGKEVSRGQRIVQEDAGVHKGDSQL